MAMYCNKHDKGSLLIVETDAQDELKSVKNVHTNLPYIKNISWCCVNGILFSYYDKLYSIGSDDDGDGAVRIQIGNM